MNIRIAYTLVCAVGMCAATAQAQQVNKCMDATGKTVYSQAPCPPTSKSASVRQSVAPAPPVAANASAKGAAAPKSAAELELDFRKRQTEQADASKKTAEKATESQQRAENCRLSRSNLAGLEAGGRQSRVNDKGERFFLDDAQLASERERARTAVEQWCKSA
jgi:hypothetical protein